MILITGGAGFFGNQLSKALYEAGEKIRILDIHNIDDPAFAHRVEFIRGDIRDKSALMKALEGVEVVYHNAAILPIAKAGRKYFDVNVLGTERVLEEARKSEIRRFIYISSSAVYYGSHDISKFLPITEKSGFFPFGDYGLSKRNAEEICKKYREHGLNISIVRPRTIIGPGRLGIFSILFDWLHDGKKIYTLGNGDNLLQYLDNRDLIRACILLKDRGFFEDFNFGAEFFGTYRKDMEALIDYANSGSRFVSLNAKWGKMTLRILDKLGVSPLVSLHYETLDKPFYFDISKAKNILNWQPKYSNKQSLIDSYEWYLRNRTKLFRLYGKTHNRILRQYILKILKMFS